jgi:aminoglycoside phosphotransferase family enzyme/adenylate kinase family enzyme
MSSKGTDHDRQNRLVDQLLTHPDCFGHVADNITHIETHISHILLVGDYAYKIKKPFSLGFLDFSTLEKRRQCCNEELRLNQRLAASLYLEVVPIRGTIDKPVIGGDGAPLEYAVKMQRFKQQDLLDRRTLDRETVDKLARLIATFHRNGAVSSDPSHNTLGRVSAPMMENFRVIRELKHPLLENERLNSLQIWTEQQLDQLNELFEERFLAGNIRECHGDLHLGNIVFFNEKITPFDGIEFNPNLRWIDTMSDIAFLLMDLQHRGLSQAADQLLNRYLEETGDYAGLPLLRLYMLYRAMVRAKVSAIRITQPDLSYEEQPKYLEEYLSYLTLAESITRHPPASLLITHGFSGSGKTTASGQLAEQLMAIRIRSDVERKRLFPQSDQGMGEHDTDRYSSHATLSTYAHLTGMAQHLLEAGFSVIVDATCLKWWQRRLFIRLADRLQSPLLILDCQAPQALMTKRIRARSQQKKDASEADYKVLVWQQKSAEPLTSEEKQKALTIDTGRFPPPGFLATVLQRLMRASP